MDADLKPAVASMVRDRPHKSLQTTLEPDLGAETGGGVLFLIRSAPRVIHKI